MLFQVLAEAASEQLSFWDRINWDALGVILTVIFSVWAIFLTIKQFQKKRLSYAIISQENIVNISEEAIKNDLEIKYKGKEISDLHLVLIQFNNTGNIEINPEDFKRPITLYFGEGSSVLGNNILNQHPKNLGVTTFVPTSNRPSLHGIDAQLGINELLLNKNDSFTLQVLVTGLKNIAIDVRISGIARIIEESNLNYSNSRGTAYILGAICGAVISFLLFKVLISNVISPSQLAVLEPAFVIVLLVSLLLTLTRANFSREVALINKFIRNR